MLLLELILRSRKVRIPPPPELFNELFLLFISCQSFEDCPFLVCDDIGDILIQPLLEIVLFLFLL